MKRRTHLRWGLGCLASVGLAPLPVLAHPAPWPGGHPAGQALVWRETVFQGFGTTLWLRAGHPHAEPLEAALHAAVQAVREVERQMSLFDPDSELSRLNRLGQLRHASASLREVLALSARVSAASQGAFDVSTQSLWSVWSDWAQNRAGQPIRGQVHGHTNGQAHGNGQQQDPGQAAPVLNAAWRARIAQAQARVNWRGVQVQGQAVQLAPGMALTLNGVAQGYAADRARAVLQAHGIAHALLDTGETSMLGHAPQGPWQLGVQAQAALDASPEPSLHARAQHRLLAAAQRGAAMPVIKPQGRAVATSSDAHSAFSADRRYHHIVDPRTGFSPRHWSRVTVLAPRAALADALTKVFFMLPPQAVLPTAARWGVDVLLQDKAGRWLASPGLPWA